MKKTFLNSKLHRIFFYCSIFLSILVIVIMITKLDNKVNKVLQWPILYYHLPLAINTFFGCFMLAFCSLLYILTKNEKWDLRAKSFAEVGFIFCTLVLITGSIWGRLNWGVFWSWEPRLISTLLLFIIYMVYFMLREYSGYYERSSRLAAILGVMILIDVPIIYYAVDMWAPEVQLHPQRSIRESDNTVTWILPIAVIGFFMVFILLFLYRLYVEEKLYNGTGDNE